VEDPWAVDSRALVARFSIVLRKGPGANRLGSIILFRVSEFALARTEEFGLSEVVGTDVEERSGRYRRRKSGLWSCRRAAFPT